MRSAALLICGNAQAHTGHVGDPLERFDGEKLRDLRVARNEIERYPEKRDTL